jgi:hypothetical protein
MDFRLRVAGRIPWLTDRLRVPPRRPRPPDGHAPGDRRYRHAASTAQALQVALASSRQAATTERHTIAWPPQDCLAIGCHDRAGQAHRAAPRRGQLGEEAAGGGTSPRLLCGPVTGQYASVEDLTGKEDLTLVGQLLDPRGAEAKARAAELLDRFGLTEAGGRRASTYSGGMRWRRPVEPTEPPRYLVRMSVPSDGSSLTDEVRAGYVSTITRVLAEAEEDPPTALL